MTELPAVAYPLPIDPYPLQGVASADRPVCAMMTAYACFVSGAPMRGAWKELTEKEQGMGFDKFFAEHDIPWARRRAWASAIVGNRMPKEFDITADGLTADEYQIRAIRHLTASGGLIGMAPGLGKTLTAVLAAKHYRHLIRGDRCWIVAPLNALGTWKRWQEELLSLFRQVQIISRDSLHKLAPENIGGVLIIDEIHDFRRMEADRTKLAHKLRLMFDVGIGLTGTVLHGGVEGVLSMFDLCVPGAALFASRWKAGEFFNCMVKKDIGSRTVTALERPTGPKAEAFMEYVHTYATMLSSHSEIVTMSVNIPEQVVEIVKIAEPWRDLDEEAADLALARLAETGEMPNAQEIAHAMCASGVDVKLDWLSEAWTDHDTPLVIFANYTATLNAAARWLDDYGVPFVRVDGDVTGEDRIECVRKFQQGVVPVFLGQIGAAGVAVDLFRGAISVALDHSWKATEYAQALARTCRRGQVNVCHHFDLATNSLQTRVIARLQKAEDFNASAIEYQDLKRAIEGVKNEGVPQQHQVAPA